MYPSDGPYSQFYDLSGVFELASFTSAPDDLIVGGGVSISDLADLLETRAAEDGVSYGYGTAAAAHLRNRFGNSAVRNAGSVGGNLAMRHAHPEFPSDLYAVLEAIGARVGIRTTESPQADVGGRREQQGGRGV